MSAAAGCIPEGRKMKLLGDEKRSSGQGGEGILQSPSASRQNT